MWQVTLVSVIVAFVGLLFYCYMRSKSAETKAVKDKVSALEAAAEKERAEDKAEDVKEAEEITRTSDNKRAIGFLRDSF